MRKAALIFFLVLLFSSALANYISIFLGVALSGAIFPYIGVYYSAGDIGFGGSLGFAMDRDEKDGGWNYILSPSVEIGYTMTQNFSLDWNARMIVVFPHQDEQLYLTGIGGGYSFPIWKGVLNLKLSADIILPISAGEKAWSRGKIVPVPFIEANYELKKISLDDL